MNRDYPSPFTRIGFGFRRAIKPEVVDYAGDALFVPNPSPGRIICDNTRHHGIPTLSRYFAPPEGRLFRTASGTSFAAPKVSHLAARLFQSFPEASSNLVRALIATSAHIPKDIPECLHGEECQDKRLQIFGYGQPDYDRARFSAQHSVMLLAESKIAVDQFQLFEIPALPEWFVQSTGKKEIVIALAYDPPTRSSRSDNYFGVSLLFKLFRNSSVDMITSQLRAITREHAGIVRDAPNEIRLNPSQTQRQNSTLHKASYVIGSRSRWQYDGSSLYLAVICQKNRWLPTSIEEQRFALVVTLHHSDPNQDVYSHIRQHARVYQRVSLRV
jgi:hypothetical protein